MRITDTHVYFFTGRDVFSNFYYAPFRHEGRTFKWSEQAIMYRKALLFGATQIAKRIAMAKTPQEAKQLGRSRQIPFNEVIWSENKMRIYEEVLMDKFSIPRLKKHLLEAGDRTFVEASPYDRIWGCGLAEDDPRIEDESNWTGQNLLGQVLKNVQLRIAASGE